jgi:hypothetical protein
MACDGAGAFAAAPFVLWIGALKQRLEKSVAQNSDGRL